MSNDKLSPSIVLDEPILSRIIVGIGEVCEITGVSARQLRYWECKGIISSLCNCTNRRYDYANIEKIVLIKDFLDQGYTLEAAAKRLEERIQQVNGVIVKLQDLFYPNYNDACDKDPNNKKSNVEMIGKSYNIDGQDYILIGLATHCQTKELLKIFSPLDRNPKNLLAKPQD
ncbi:MAG: hypothetical protein CVU90_03640 [Firmicutes bacterium HGW-Firmicutes-15]|nr:MAG: hypothetical protein CVU90_03640 [Firmicutes bacterium HGW-Firmicutes-15]